MIKSNCINNKYKKSRTINTISPQITELSMEVKLLLSQSCLTLCNSMDYTLSGSSVRGILQARILEWVAIPSPGHLPNPGVRSISLALQADSSSSEPPGKPIKH